MTEKARFPTPFLRQASLLVLTGALAGSSVVCAGPYSAGFGDAANPHDAPVPGFVGPHGEGLARLADGSGGFQNENNYANPVFFDWASEVIDYSPAPDVNPAFGDPLNLLGEVTGDLFDIVSLGDLSAAQIGSGVPVGTITVRFSQPVRNFSGADFVVFENAFVADHDTGGSGVGGSFAELAYVEVSNDGVNFVRFPAVSLTPGPVGAFGSINPTNVFNLAGKHANSQGRSWGTPFDLSQVGLSEITHIRIVDIPGNGSFLDAVGGPIFDSWLTAGSGGADLEAVGQISREMAFADWPQLFQLAAGEREAADDPDRDGLPNLLEYAFARLPWAQDAGPATNLTVIDDSGFRFLELSFDRDERATDLTYEVQASTNLVQWTTIARSVAGQPLAGANGFTPVITEMRASPVASIGVVRRVRIRDVQAVNSTPWRFLRVKVIQAP